MKKKMNYFFRVFLLIQKIKIFCFVSIIFFFAKLVVVAVVKVVIVIVVVAIMRTKKYNRIEYIRSLDRRLCLFEPATEGQ